MSEGKVLLNCYHRGCGEKFDPSDNKEDACVHHPGTPVFHDAYKGWSCCNKKCTDFTEFLNIKGCTRSSHSSEKPIEPEKLKIDKSKADEVIEYRPPVNNSPMLERPSFVTPQVTLTPTLSPTLLEQIKGLTANEPLTGGEDKNVKVGECCKNKACKAVYNGPESDSEVCLHHPGVAIFHEGLKFWSCCQKRTTDFSVFLAQPGCTEGSHVWIAQNLDKEVKCRMDWHQTGSFVVISIYAKKYHPNKSFIKLNPIRLTVSLFFPEENSDYHLDVVLRGIVEVENCSATMLPTKVEIKLKKAEPGSWAKLDFPTEIKREVEKPSENENDNIEERIDAVDLSDL